MGLGVSGHNEENDDVLAGQGGVAPGGGTLIDPNSRLWNPAGVGAGYDNDIARYRQRGAQTQAAVQLDQTHADEARRMQLGSLGHLEMQARGSAPSSAAILSQRANQNAAQGIAAAGLRKGGPGAALAAQRQVLPGALDQMMQTNASNANMRAAETSRGQAAFAAGATGAMGQDIQAGVANAQLVAQQRALDEAHQQANERLAWDTRKTQMNNANEFFNQRQNEELNRRRAAAAQEAEDWGKVMGYGNSAVGGVIGFTKATNDANAKGGTSDYRAKTNIVPMGSLHSLERY